MKKILALSALLFSSAFASAAAPALNADLIKNPALPENGGSGCLIGLVQKALTGSDISVDEDDGLHLRDDRTAEYWMQTTTVRAYGLAVQIVTDQSWTEKSDSVHGLYYYTAPTAHKTAHVVELLRGGDLGYPAFDIDVSSCIASGSAR